ncbi:hypothetical protein [Treponema sp.]|uniref:hypothetical protein n=1 Tax=Treponema sp. TaxID=166 RepID=UPI0025D1EC00|nr:hypothetical protein [Treponema sp.]MCR5218139.1 hypothetical protein [Treponema sp.]
MKKRHSSLQSCLLFFLPLVMTTLTPSCSLLDGNSKTGRYSIKGCITLKGSDSTLPLEGVKITVEGLSSVSATTSSDGSYTLNGLGKGSVSLKAKKSGYTIIPDYENASEISSGSTINVAKAATSGTVLNANFVAVEGDSLTISDIQGSSLESPMKGQTVYGITGVVTMICRRAPHFKYDTTDYDGETIPQWLSYDGFFLEALPEDKDLTGTKSNGIFVNTHDDAYDDTEETHWKSGIPTDLEAGDVVVVSGVVEETRTLDRYGSSEGTLTRTEINAETVAHKTSSSVNVTAPYPDGVLLTYSSANAESWTSGHTDDGYREARVLTADSNAEAPMKDAISVLETVESMVIRIDDPLVIGATYYNLTSVLADGGLTPDNTNAINGYPRTFNENWQGNVIWENADTGVQDFNEEVLFVDYQAVDWTTFYAIPQIGDYLVDSTSARVFRGVMDYTVDGLYMAHPLNNTAACYVQSSSNAQTSVTPYYTRSDNETIESVTGETIPNQKWNFDITDSWYYKANASIAAEISGSGVSTSKSVSTTNSVPWRTGSKAASFDANELFTPKWTSESSTTKGNTNLNSLTVAAFNIENYEAQGSSNSKQENVALVIKNNLLYPDVLVIVEMGDDTSTTIHYDNQDNSWAEKDGVVTAVRNFSGIIDVIKKTYGGPQYDFMCVDPHEQDSGGKPGVNIRVGIMYNTERVTAKHSGLPSNDYFNTHGGSLDTNGNRDYSTCTTILDESEWPVQTSNHHAQGWALAEAEAGVYKGTDGNPHLTQSPCYIHSSYFNNSRRPIIGEFVINNADGTPSDQNFFVVGCHLGSKRGDFPLYGNIQPPLLLSEVKRDGQARTVYDFVNSILGIDENTKVIVGGDMNDFAYSTPQRILKGEIGNQIMWSIVEETMPYVEQFSYTFQGNLQEIDHIFVTKALWDKVGFSLADKTDKSDETWKDYCFIPHINSMFTRNNHVNLSDHDPDLIRIPDVFTIE